MGLVFAQSAFKHGVTKAQIEFVVAHCGLVFDEPAPPESSIPDDRSLYLGDDAQGTALEVVAIAVDAERLLVRARDEAACGVRRAVQRGAAVPEVGMRTKSGSALTDGDLEELSREAETGYDLRKAERRRVGRLSLSLGTSPRAQFRIEAEVFERAKKKAASESRSLSDVGRELFSEYVASRDKPRSASRPRRHAHS